MKIVIQGKPLSKMRARHAHRGDYVITYDPQKEDKEAIRHELIKAVRRAFDSDSKDEVMEASALGRAKAFGVTFRFYLPIPASDSRHERNGKLWGFELATCKPDYDNLEKFYLDCSSKSIWPDDAMVVQGNSSKHFSDNPRVEIEILEKKGLTMHEKAVKVIKNFSPDELKEFLYDVRTLATLDPECVGRLTGDPLQDWLSSAACMMARFSFNHLDALKRVAKASGGDITEEVCRAMHFGEEDE